MPTVPRAARTQQTTALPGARLTQAETPESRGAGLEAAKARRGQTLGQVGESLAEHFSAADARLRKEAADKADEVSLTNASNRLDAFEIKRLHDPKEGALNIHGQASFDLPEAVDADFNKAADEIEAGLNPRVKDRFLRLRGGKGSNIAINVRRHVAGEMQAFDASETKASAVNASSLAAANALDPKRVGLEIGKGVAAIEGYAKRNGQPQAETDAQISAFKSDTHIAVIDNLVAADQPGLARAYFQEAMKAGEIAGNQIDDVRIKLDTASVLKTGLEASEAIWKASGPKGKHDPINLADMETQARERFKNDPKSLNATIQYLRERKAGVDAQRQDEHDYNLGTVSKMVSDDRTLGDIHSTKEYLELSPKQQGQVNDAVLQRAIAHASQGYYSQTREATLTTLDQTKKQAAGWAEYWRLSVPDVLTNTSEDALNARRLELGDALVNQLLTQKRGLDKGEAVVRDATIDADQFKTLAAQAGVKVYGPMDEDEQSAAGRLKNTVETAIDAEQRRSGKPLDRASKDAIAKDILGKKVMLNYWGPDPERVAAMVTDPTDRAKAYVPLAKMPAAHVDEALALIKTFGPETASLSPTDLRSRFQDRIEHAYAIGLLGGTRSEQIAILKGAQ